MKLHIIALGLAIAIGAVLTIQSVAANDRSQEREDLINIIQELELVRAVVSRVREGYSVDRQGVIFRYEALDSRLAQLQKDIELHVQVMDTTPRFERFQLIGTNE